MAAVGAGQEAGKTQKKMRPKGQMMNFSQLKMSSVKLKEHPVTACISDEREHTGNIYLVGCRFTATDEVEKTFFLKRILLRLERKKAILEISSDKL